MAYKKMSNEKRSNKKLFAVFGVVLLVVGAGLFAAGWFGKKVSNEDQEKINLSDKEKLDTMNMLVRDTFAGGVL
jgi:hypothetical protein